MAKKKVKPKILTFAQMCKKVVPNFIAKTAATSVVELNDGAPNENTYNHVKSGQLNFTDTAGDTHTATVAPASGGYLGTFQAVVNQVTDTVTWTFTLNDGAIDHLRAGQALVQKYTITLKDAAGNATTAVVTVTIIGTNDAPVIKADMEGSITEDATNSNLKDTGDLSFTDVDTLDAHAITSTYNNNAVWSGGALDSGVVAQLAAGFSTSVNTGTKSGVWSYEIPNSLVQFLNDGETITLSFTVKVTDDSGSANNNDTEVITITIYGTNDAPVAAADTNWTKEDTNLSAMGNVLLTQDHAGAPTGTFGDKADTDVDTNDALTVTTTGLFTGQYGVLILNPDGTYIYTLYTQAQNAAAYALVQGLSDLQMLEDSFNYTVSDGTSTSSSTLKITIFGTDDGVSITDLTPAANGGDAVVDEDDLPGGSDTTKDSLTSQGTFTVSAPDGIDTLSVKDANFISGGVVTAFPVSLTTPLGNTLTITGFNPATGVVSYEYTLNGAESHANGDGENDLLESFTVTLTDADPVSPDTVTGQLDVGIVDDIPSISAGAPPADSLQVDETILSTDASADFSGLFTGDYGADGAGTTAYALSVSAPGVDSGLVDSATGQSILLFLESGLVVGRVGGAVGAISFTVSVDSTTGVVTLDQQRSIIHSPDAGPDQATSLSAADLVKLTATITDKDGDAASASVDLANAISFKDDAPSISATAATLDSLQVDETNLIVNATANFAGLFTPSFGNDGAGSLSYALDVSAPGADSGLDDSATGQDILLFLESGLVVGRVGGAAGVVSFTIGVNSTTGVVTLDQQRSMIHSPDAGPDQAASLGAADLVRLTATIVDADGDSATATVNLGNAISFKDDAPSILAGAVVAGSLQVDETTLSADAITNFAGLFTSTYGADGAGSTAYALSVSAPGADSGLDDSATGQDILLFLESGVVVGRVGGAAGAVSFTVSVSSVTGVVTLDQVRAVLHTPDVGPDQATLLGAADLVKLTATITDKDGDTASASIDLRDAISFKDDAPSITASAATLDSLQVDESNLASDASVSFAGLFGGVYGADGAGTTAYALSVSAPGADSGLDDSATGQDILLFLESGLVVGRVGGAAGAVSFTVSIDSTTGVVTLDQQRSIIHSPDAGPDQATSLGAADLVKLTATITDKDGDTASASINLGNAISFRDDAPAANSDVDSVTVAPVQVLRFDNIPLADDTEQPIPAGYGGFNWTQTGVYNPPAFSSYVPTSGENLAFFAEADPGMDVPGYPGNAQDPITIIPVSGQPFAFLGASFVSRNWGSLPITVTGYPAGGGAPIVHTIFAAYATPIYFDFTTIPGFENIVRIDLHAPTRFGFDDFATQGASPAATGNVVTGADGGLGSDANATDGVADNAGADGFGSISWAGQAGSTVAGAHGVLTVDANGNYSYAVNSNDPVVRALGSNESLTETFTYTILDKDGDPATAMLTITVNGADDPVSITDLKPALQGGDVIVDEDDLPAGSDTSKESLTGTGSFLITAPDGVDDVTVGGQPVITNGVFTPISFTTPFGNTLAITAYNAATGVLTYTYTLTGAESHASANGENSLFENFTVTLTDTDGSSATATLSANIVDDVPTANNDTYAPLVTAPVVISGLFGNDVFGADGVNTATSVTATNGVGGTVVYNNNGTFTFTPSAGFNGVGSFTYTITDGDGDQSTATVTLSNVQTNTLPTAGSQPITVDEDGLPGGIAGGPGDVAGQAITQSGTLIHNFNGDGPSTPASSDPINFSPMHNTAVTSAGPVPVTSGGAALTYFWDATNDVLYASTNASSLANAQTTAVFKVALTTSTGAYTYTQIKPIDHPVANTEDDLVINISYQVKDSNGDSATGTLSVTVDDDSPSAGAITKTINEASPVNSNVMLLLDVSGSMDNASGLTSLTRLDVLKASVVELLEQYDNMGDVSVRIVTFSTNANPVGSTWMTVAQAKAAVLALTADGSTNYDETLSDAVTAFSSSGSIAGAQNVAYFVSDGQPNEPSGSEGINASEQAVWENFLTANDVVSFALGAGSGVTTSALDPVAFNGVTGQQIPSIAVTDLSQLTATLVGTVNAVTTTGNLLTDPNPDGGFGADGGYVRSVAIGGQTFTFNGTNSISVTGSGGATHTFDDPSNVLTITTAIGGKLIVDLDDGNYTYTGPSMITSNQTEAFTYTLIDRDNDTAASTLTINITNGDRAPIVRDDAIITNVGTQSQADQIVIPKYALLWNDTDPDGQAVSVTGVSGGSSGTPTNGTTTVTFTESSNGDSDGGSFTYTGTAGALTDTGAVTVTRVGSNTDPLNGTGLNNILLDNDSSNTLNGFEGNDVLIGNGGDDALNGGDGHDLLAGGLGNDTLTGGNGNDVFLFNTALDDVAPGTNIDTIAGFDADPAGGQDKIWLDSSIFTALSPGALSAANFVANTSGTASTATQFIIYETDTGNLYYDPNGSGAGGRVHFATITGLSGTVDETDFFIV